MHAPFSHGQPEPYAGPLLFTHRDESTGSDWRTPPGLESGTDRSPGTWAVI